MKIIRWLLSHSFLILIIVAVIYGYMFWGNLAGKDTPVGKAIAYLSDEFVEVREFVDAVKAKQAKLAGGQPSENEEMAAAATATTANETEQNSSAGADSVNADQQPVSITYSHNNNRVEQHSMDNVSSGAEISQAGAAVTAAELIQNSDDSAAGNNGRSQDEVSIAAVNESKEVFVTPEIEKQLSNVDETGRALSEAPQSVVVRDVWIAARKAFYQRNYQLSEQSYQKVIDSTVDNFDAYGELGNVYFNQGKNKQAASAYYEAAAIMVHKGQVNRARSLMGLLRHLDKSKADELQKLIDSNLS